MNMNMNILLVRVFYHCWLKNDLNDSVRWWAAFAASAWLAVSLGLVRWIIRKTSPVINKPTPSRMRPTLGWKISQDIEQASKNSGIQTIRAAMNMANPTTPDKNPPKRGTYPRRCVIGLKNAQMEKTIKKYAPSLIKFLLVFMRFSSRSIISW